MIIVATKMLQLIWAWIGVGLTVQPTFEEFSIIL